MTRVGSPLFLGWVAFCSAVCVGVATGRTSGDSIAVQIGSALLALAAAVVIAFVPLVLFSRKAAPVAPPSEVAAPAPVTAAPAPADDLKVRLEALHAAACEWRDEQPDTRVEAWIETTQQLLDAELPGAGRYFGALPVSAWPAQLARLETIVRDFV